MEQIFLWLYAGIDDIIDMEPYINQAYMEAQNSEN